MSIKSQVIQRQADDAAAADGTDYALPSVTKQLSGAEVVRSDEWRAACRKIVEECLARRGER